MYKDEDKDEDKDKEKDEDEDSWINNSVKFFLKWALSGKQHVWKKLKSRLS